MTTTTASTTTTTSVVINADILILNTSPFHSGVPVLTDDSGKDDRDLNFAIDDDVEVYASCSLTWRGEHFVFGGYEIANYQIAKIIGCELKNVGELPFSHIAGGCANMADNRVYLCFNDDPSTDKKCRVATSPLGQFVETTQSYESHRNTRIAASESK